jgi:hypothetical protein
VVKVDETSGAPTVLVVNVASALRPLLAVATTRTVCVPGLFHTCRMPSSRPTSAWPLPDVPSKVQVVPVSTMPCASTTL